MSRGSQLDVTELTKKGIRVQDPRVLNIRGTVLRGVSVGRTEVQVNDMFGTFSQTYSKGHGWGNFPDLTISKKSKHI